MRSSASGLKHNPRKLVAIRFIDHFAFLPRVGKLLEAEQIGDMACCGRRHALKGPGRSPVTLCCPKSALRN